MNISRRARLSGTVAAISLALGALPGAGQPSAAAQPAAAARPAPLHSPDIHPDRTVTFRLLAPILATAGASFVSLQVGTRVADLAALPADAITDLAPELRDFAETAGALAKIGRAHV